MRKLLIASAMALMAGSAAANTVRLTEQSRIGNWSIALATDQITDSKSYLAQSFVPGGFIQIDCTPPSLYVGTAAKRPPSLNVSFRTAGYLAGDYGDILFRVDDKAARSLHGSYSTNTAYLLSYSASSYDAPALKPNGTVHHALIEYMKGGMLLRVRFKTSNENVEASYNIDGVADAAQTLSDDCAKYRADKSERERILDRLHQMQRDSKP